MLLFVSFPVPDFRRHAHRIAEAGHVLAFMAAALSLAAVALRRFRDGAIDATSLLGGLFMLALGIGGYRRLKALRP